METKNDLFASSFKAGLIIAAVGLVWFIIQYVAGIAPYGILQSILFGLISLAVNIVLVVIFLKNYRNRNEGIISFVNAFLFCFIALACSGFLYILITFLFNKYIDPMYMTNMMEAQKTYWENYLQGKASEQQIADTLDKLDVQAKNATSILQNLKSFGIILIVGGIESLIVGAIMKKNPDVFDNASGGVI